MSRKTTDNPTLAAMIVVDYEFTNLTDAGKAQVLRWALAEHGHVLNGQPTQRSWPDDDLDEDGQDAGADR